jgi:hypothetical protein
VYLFKRLTRALYSASGHEDATWTVVTAEQLRDLGAPRHTESVWRHSALVECREDGTYSYSKGLARTFRLRKDALVALTEASRKGSRRYHLHTGARTRREPGTLTSVLTDEHGHAHPALLDNALRLYDKAKHVIDHRALLDLEAALAASAKPEHRETLAYLRIYIDSIDRQIVARRGDGTVVLQNAYRISMSGRTTFRGGGPQGMMREAKALAYDLPGVINLDIQGCHTHALRVLAEALEDVGVEIDTSPLDDYLPKGGKDWATKVTGLPRRLVKIVEHATKYGANLPVSETQARAIEGQATFELEICKTVRKHVLKAEQDGAYKALHKIFGPISRMVRQMADGLLGTYYDAHKVRGSWMMYNAAGMGFRPSDYTEGHKRRAKAMAWHLQGLEAGFVHRVAVLLSQVPGITVMANEHDGLILMVEDWVDLEAELDKAQELAREASGFFNAVLVEKPFVDEEDVTALRRLMGDGVGPETERRAEG